MGRLQKKKDPDKKKAQRAAAKESESSASQDSAAIAGKANSVPKKSSALSTRPKPVLKTAPQEQNFIQKSIQFLREVKIELKKVTWPTRKQTTGSTAVVIVLVMIISIFLGIVDFGLSSLVRVVLP
jgi:preprotein translocase subunit SecE